MEAGVDCVAAGFDSAFDPEVAPVEDSEPDFPELESASDLGPDFSEPDLSEPEPPEGFDA